MNFQLWVWKGISLLLFHCYVVRAWVEDWEARSVPCIPNAALFALPSCGADAVGSQWRSCEAFAASELCLCFYFLNIITFSFSNLWVYGVCVFVCAWVWGMHAEVRGQLPVLGPIFHLFWDKVSCSAIRHAVWSQASKDPLCGSRLVLKALGSWTHMGVSSFAHILEIRAQVLPLGPEAVNPQASSPPLFAVLLCSVPQADLELSVLLPHLSAGITWLLCQTWSFRT